MEMAFKLMYMGMTTVFASLFIVVLVGTGIIRFVNKFVPAEEVVQKKSEISSPATTIPSSTMAAIASAVSTITNGKGTIVDVKKV